MRSHKVMLFLDWGISTTKQWVRYLSRVPNSMQHQCMGSNPNNTMVWILPVSVFIKALAIGGVPPISKAKGRLSILILLLHKTG